MNLDLVIFDLDGTLVQLNFTKKGMRTVRANLRSVFADVEIKREFIPLITDLETALDTLQESVQEPTADRIRNEAFRQLANMERDAVIKQHIYPDAKAILHQVAESDVTFTVATNNTREAAVIAMEAAGFPEPDYLVAFDDVGHPKPDPAMINELFDRLDETPSRLAIVGDRTTDAECVKHACANTEIICHTVLVDRKGESAEKVQKVDHTVSSLTEAIKMLSSLK